MVSRLSQVIERERFTVIKHKTEFETTVNEKTPETIVNISNENGNSIVNVNIDVDVDDSNNNGNNVDNTNDTNDDNINNDNTNNENNNMENNNNENNNDENNNANRNIRNDIAHFDPDLAEIMRGAIEALTGTTPGPDEDGYFLIEKVLKRRLFGKIWKYKVRWLGWGEDHDSFIYKSWMNAYFQKWVQDVYVNNIPREDNHYDVDLLAHFLQTLQEVREEMLLRYGFDEVAEVISSDVIRSDVISSDVISSDVISSEDAISSEVISSDVVKSSSFEVSPTEVISTDEVVSNPAAEAVVPNAINANNEQEIIDLLDDDDDDEVEFMFTLPPDKKRRRK
jgi:hypothetical protein